MRLPSLGACALVPCPLGVPVPSPGRLRPLLVHVRWPLWRLGSLPGGEGVVVRRAAAFPAASSVGVARSPRVGVPSIPRVVYRWLVGVRWWDPYGVRCLLRRCVLGAAPPGIVRSSVGVGRRWSPVVVCPSWVWVVAFAVLPFSSVPWSLLLPLHGSWVVSCPHVVSLPAPCPYGCLPLLGAPPCPPA